VHEGKGIELSYLLAVRHIESGMRELERMGVKEEEIGVWRYLAGKLLTRRK
jgi:hypothetical protein